MRYKITPVIIHGYKAYTVDDYGDVIKYFNRKEDAEKYIEELIRNSDDNNNIRP